MSGIVFYVWQAVHLMSGKLCILCSAIVTWWCRVYELLLASGWIPGPPTSQAPIATANAADTDANKALLSNGAAAQTAD